MPDIDWSLTDLGERARWPQPLRLAVDIVLNCPFPMLLVWGADRVTVFNDAYATLAGPGHAQAPGGKVPALWPAPLAAGRDGYDQALRGEPARLARRPLELVRPRGPERLDCDLYFTPVRDEQDAVRGVLCTLERSARPEPSQAAAALRILVVEDNLDSQYLVCEMLKAFGYHTDGVAHGEDALTRLAGAVYDVLFSDVSLPGISGVELARRALAAQPGLKVIFASGYGDALLRHVEFPFISLQKPYDLDQLQATLAQLSPPAPLRP